MVDSFGLDWSALSAFLTVVAIDVALAGDNALVVGMAAAGLPPALRRRAIALGILAAAGLRIIFALITVHLLHMVGLLAAGGLLLLWVSWKLWRELRAQAAEAAAHAALKDGSAASPTAGSGAKTLRQAVIQIILADVSMSLDNVLAVAGAARDHIAILVLGLGLSVVLMGLAASLIARVIHRHRWIAYVGLAIILFVALSMLWDGAHQLAAQLP
ncbi:MAG TPA: YjbE family putative metal transport protein [Patescibacteria group bacterium]|nr:YjbE family putative metal transport protein [Patescibacteria group bacterium]